MDWRSGSRQNPTSSAFRGISSRSRGRGRGRGAPRGLSGDRPGIPHAISPSVTPAPLPSQPPPPSPLLAQPNPPSINQSFPSKPAPRRGSHQPPRHTQSLSHLDTSKALAVPSIEPSTTPGGRRQVGRRAPPNFPGVAAPSLPPKLDLSTPTTPVSPRPKTPRKRSHNRTRSSSKASTTQQVSSAPSTSSLQEYSRDAPRHMALHTGPPDVQSFDPRTDIDTLVERVRAMAMAGSAIDKEKDKEGTHIPHDGHIDWAGDDDDTLPDLDDWVRPTQAPQKEAEKTDLDRSSERPSLPPLEEVANLNPPSAEIDIQKTSGLNEPEPGDIVQQVQDGRGAKKLKTASKEVEATPGKTKSRGKHGRKKSTVSEAIVPTLAIQTSAGSEIQSNEALGPPKTRPPLVHPLPPKPQLSAPPVRGFRSRGPVHTNLPVARASDSISDEVSSAIPREDQSMEPPLTQVVKPVTEAENKGNAASSEPQVRKSAFDPSVDWANAPRTVEKSIIESVREAPDAPSSSAGQSPDTNTRQRVFDPSVDWSKAPRTSTNRSPRPSPVPSGRASSPSRPAPSYDRSRGPFPHNKSPRSSARASAQPPLHTRSQMNSPERSPHRWQDRVGPTHLRAHSSPQTGPGTRTHTSRPVITLDALSRISRTLGVPGATTPPRGPAAEVVVAD